MADAERLAAARKKFEQLKKQKAKKEKAQKNKNADKADDTDAPVESTIDDADTTAAADTTTTSETPADTIPKPETAPEAEAEADDIKPSEPDHESTSAGASTEDPLVSAAAASTEDAETTTADRPSLARELTESQQSRLRSESFKSGGETEYKKQAARIEQLEKENERLEKELEDRRKQVQKVEGQVEELQEAREEVVALRGKVAKFDEGVKETERLKSEIQSLERQNAQLAASSKDRRRSSTTASRPAALDDLLATKTSTIETLELEISNLRHAVTTAETANLALTARVAELEVSLKTSEDALSAAQSELTTLRTTAAAASSAAPSSDDSATKASDDNETRFRLLTADLTAAQRTATDATERATTLQKKIDTLTSLHRDAEGARMKELDKLRSETAALRAKAKAAVDAPGNDDDDDDDEIEGTENDTNNNKNLSKSSLRAQIRALESEIFDLKRGVWREKRMQIQEAGGDPLASLDALDPAYNYNNNSSNSHNPTIQSPGSRSQYDDIDLATPGHPNQSQSQGYFRNAPAGVTSPNRTKSSGLSAFSVNNVLNAFTSSGLTSPPVAHAQHQQASPNARRKSSGQGFFAAAAELVTGQQSDTAFLGGEGGEDDDDDAFTFDEDAFRKAREEEDKRRLERVREVKRGLVDWRGWRVDLVGLCEDPQGSGGGEGWGGVFDV